MEGTERPSGMAGRVFSLVLAETVVLAGLVLLARIDQAGNRDSAPASVFGPNVRVDDTGGLMDTRALNPKAFVSENGTIYVGWADGRSAPGTMDRDDPYLAKSVDGGRTYGRNVPIVVTSNMSGGVGGIDVAADGTMFVLFGEAVVNTGPGHYFFSKSLDGGTTFSPAVVIDGHRWDESCVCVGGAMARHGGNLYVAWGQFPQDARGQGVFLARSTDRGVSWGTPALVDSGTSNMGSVDIAVDDAGIVYVAWADGWVGKAWIARSLDAGLTFGPSVVVSHVGWIAILASVAAGRTGDAYVLWSTILSPANNSGTLFLTRVVNGVPLFPPTQVTDWPANSTHIYANPSVAVDGRGFVYAAWGDSRTDYWGDIYFARSIDGGRTFEPNERIVDLALGDGTVQVYPDIAANANGSVVVVWTDTRQDPDGGDIYSAVPTYLSDLSVEPSDISWSPPSPTEGTPVVIDATIRNIGWDISAPTTARFYNGTPPAPPIGADQPLPPLSINGSATVSVTWTAPPPGTYDVCVVADPDDNVTELDEANNLACRTITVVPAPLPDLALTSADIRLVPAPPVANGTAVLVEATVHNAGDATSAPTAVRFYDGVPPALVIGTDQPLTALAAGGSATVSVTWTATPPGSHDVCVVVDPDDVVAERSEDNNSACLGAAVLPPETRPDYSPFSPEPAGTTRAGLSQSVTVSLEVKNAGNATATGTATLALYNASTPTTPFAAFPVPPLGPSETSSRLTASWTSPATPGTYAVVADVDHGDDLVEWNETNNRFTWAIDVLAGPVTNLVVGAPNVTAAETYVTSGTPLSFSVLDQSGTGIRNTTYRVDGGPWVNYTASGPLTLAGEGAHLVEWRSEDNAGNVEPIASATLLVDDTPPTSSLSIGDPKHVAAETFVTSATPLFLAATDGGVLPVGIAGMEYRLDGAAAWTQFVTPISLAGEGAHLVEHRSRDLLGNAEPLRATTVVVDDTAPAIAADMGTPRYEGAVTYVTSATTFTLTAADGGAIPVGLASVEVRVGGTWTAYGAPFTLAGPDGPKSVEYRAADLLGNAFADQRAVVLDDTPPTTTSDHADGPYDAGTTFAFHATDVGSGVARTEVRVDGGAWATYAAPLALAAGAHTIRFRSVDHLNNTEAERTLSVTIEGAPPPPPETNWKPLVAAVFAAVLMIVGVWSARRVPSKASSRPRVRAFVLTALPFVVLEAATGVASLLTGWLSIPPILGPGTAADMGILVAGVAVLAHRVRKWTLPR